jgi:hypothetical protein
MQALQRVSTAYGVCRGGAQVEAVGGGSQNCRYTKEAEVLLVWETQGDAAKSI